MGYSIKTGPIVAVIVIVAALFGGRYAYQHGYLSPSSSGPAAVPVAAALPELDDKQVNVQTSVQSVPLPSVERAQTTKPEIRIQEMAWNAQTGLNFANGGEFTTRGSIMANHGVNLHLVWEDDVNKQATALVNFAAALKKGNPQPTEGAHFMALMGDGSGAMIGSIAKELREQGADPEIIGSAGYSRGEDQLMGPPSWKENPKLMRGSLISGFLRDGDWDIALKVASDNAIPNNPDEKTYDPTAINWYSADDYIKAADAYINGVCEDRAVVINGKRTGEMKNVCINAVVTWTPGDVNVAERRGGLATIVSTKQYRSQMPNTLIGIKQWNQANSALIVEMLAAMFEGGDQVKTNPLALHRAAQINSVIWGNQQPGEYWEKYFKGVSTKDKQGIQVELGGSSVNNLNDNMVLYGLLPGTTNVFAATYTVFANIVKQQYPALVPEILPVEKVLNASYIQRVYEKYGKQMMAPAEAPRFVANGEIKHVVSKKAWQINFETGQASFTPEALTQLNMLKNDLLIAGELAIEIHGYTDNTGDPTKNTTLSQQRASAVKNWLVQQSRTDFDPDRFTAVQGHGQNNPVATNSTDTGKAKNRRVEVVLGSS